jgi:hypothetical protein
MKPAGHWHGLAAALLGAATLHVAAAVLMSRAAPGAASPAAAGVDQRRLTIELRPAVLTAPTFEETAEPPPEPSGEEMMAVPLAEAEPQATSIGPPLPLADPEAAESARYFNIGEVDTPAVPRPDWEVDVALLMGLGVRSFSIDVLINETGTAEQCAVTRIEPDQSNELRHAVAAKFCETVLSPAKRRGVAVRSIRHIELLLAPP